MAHNYYTTVKTVENIMGGDLKDYRLNFTDDFRTFEIKTIKARRRVSYQYHKQIEVYEILMMPWFEILAKIGGISKGIMVCFIMVTFINRKVLAAKLIRGLVIKHNDSKDLFSKKKYKYKFSTWKTIKDYACCLRNDKERAKELKDIYTATTKYEEELDIFKIKDDINKLKASVSVLLSTHQHNDLMVEDIQKVFLHKKTLWNDDNLEIEKIRQKEADHLKAYLENYDKLFVIINPNEYKFKPRDVDFLDITKYKSNITPLKGSGIVAIQDLASDYKNMIRHDR